MNNAPALIDIIKDIIPDYNKDDSMQDVICRINRDISAARTMINRGHYIIGARLIEANARAVWNHDGTTANNFVAWVENEHGFKSTYAIAFISFPKIHVSPFSCPCNGQLSLIQNIGFPSSSLLPQPAP